MEFNKYNPEEQKIIASMISGKDKVIYGEDDLKPEDYWYSSTDGLYGIVEYPIFFEPRVSPEDTIDLGIDWDKLSTTEHLRQKFNIKHKYIKGKRI